ncbi:MAG: hypothetical protein ABI454_12950 [Sphingomicrobium sp.]
MLFNQFDRVIIISLAERTDRRREMIRQLRCFSVRAEFFDAYRMSDAGPFLKIGSHGAYLSHLEVLRQASDANESLLILQDDCDFTPEVRHYQVPEGTDIFYGGYEASQPDDLLNSEIIGAHCMGFSARAAQLAYAYLSTLLKVDSQRDPTAALKLGFNAQVLPPIDGALVCFRRVHPQLKTVFKLLSRQRPSRSDVSPKFFDNLQILRGLIGIARRAKALSN